MEGLPGVLRESPHEALQRSPECRSRSSRRSRDIGNVEEGIRVGAASPLCNVVARTGSAVQNDDCSSICVRDVPRSCRTIAEPYCCRLIDEDHVAFTVPCIGVINDVPVGVDATWSLLLK